ncbi:MAG: beta-lactamase family protein [Lentisphaeria bacterium]|nr:beta-lactamase family protein [Lentisphaeria bacterium]
MSIKYRFIPLVGALLIAILFSGCSSVAVEPRPSNTTCMQDAIRPMIDSGEYPGAISILYNNGWQETACLGYADVDKKIPMTLDAMFMQCSQTKGFCGVTIAILVEEGKISLDDPVSGYLPEFKDLKVAVKDASGKVTGSKPAQNVLTIRMVMNHTGGFGFEIPTKSRRGWPALSLRDTAREAASLPLQFEPGTAVKYSNTGIDIGAAIVEVVTGQSWDSFLKERVLDPLGMTDTTFNPTDEQLARSILMYNVNPGRKAAFREFHPSMPLPHNGPHIHPSAGAGLWTTAQDQLKFYKMLMNLGTGDNGVRILKAETVRNLLATSSRPAGLGHYSLGLTVDPRNGFFGHGGAWGTSCMVNPDKKQLNLWIVQLTGNLRELNAARYSAANQFFSIQLDNSAAEAYTGRME